MIHRMIHHCMGRIHSPHRWTWWTCPDMVPFLTMSACKYLQNSYLERSGHGGHGMPISMRARTRPGTRAGMEVPKCQSDKPQARPPCPQSSHHSEWERDRKRTWSGYGSHVANNKLLGYSAIFPDTGIITTGELNIAKPTSIESAADFTKGGPFLPLCHVHLRCLAI